EHQVSVRLEAIDAVYPGIGRRVRQESDHLFLPAFIAPGYVAIDRNVAIWRGPFRHVPYPPLVLFGTTVRGGAGSLAAFVAQETSSAPAWPKALSKAATAAGAPSPSAATDARKMRVAMTRPLAA